MIEELSLSENQLGDSLTQLCPIFEEKTTLKILSLDLNNASDACWLEILVKVLNESNKTKLTRLRIGIYLSLILFYVSFLF